MLITLKTEAKETSSDLLSELAITLITMLNTVLVAMELPLLAHDLTVATTLVLNNA